MSLGLPLLDCSSPTSSSSSAPSPVTPTYYGQEFPFDPKHMISPYSSPSPAHDIPFYLPHHNHHHHHHPQQQHPSFYPPHHHPQQQQHSSPSLSPTPSSAQSKTYSFVSLPGNAVKKRPRRRYDEIERPYRCNWGDCDKAYGTLNHLNNHVVLQAHGEKRNPAEFKELRMQLKLKKKGLMASQAKQEQVANSLAPQPQQDAAPSCAPTSPSYQLADPSLMYPVTTTTTTSPSSYYSPHHQRNLSSYELAYPSQPSYPSPTHYEYSSSPSSSSCRHSFGDYESSQRESIWAPRSSIDSLPANSSLFTPLPGYNESYHPSPSLLPSMRGGQIPTAYRYEGEGRPGWTPHH